jgi:hypothetical protein
MQNFTDREMYEQAAGNMVAFVVAADAFLRDRGIEPEELYRSFGSSYAPGWDPLRGDVPRAGREVALNLTSGGFETSLTPDHDAVVVRARWTEQHDGEDWPTAVRPVLERATPLLFEAAMARIGAELTASSSDQGMEFRLAPRPA